MRKIAFLLILSTSIYARVSCSDFNIQSEAQNYCEQRQKGYKLLDRDKDGEACECLKGGSGYQKSSCKRWRKKHGK